MLASIGDGDTDNYTKAAAGGQVNGGSTSGDSESDSFTNTEKGQYTGGAAGYSLSASFSYHEQGNASAYADEQGNTSGNVGGMASGGGYGDESGETSNYTLDENGTNTAESGSSTISGTTSYHDSASASETFNDSGSYGGQGAGPPGPLESMAPANSPSVHTYNGNYSDYETDDSGEETHESGTYLTNVSGTTDGGSISTQESASSSYTSSGNDGENWTTTSSSNDGWQNSGDDSATGTTSGTYSDTPTTNNDGGNYWDSETAHTTANGTTTASTNFSTAPVSSSSSLDDDSSATTTYYYQDSGTYTSSNGVESVAGNYQATTLTSETDNSQSTNGSGISLSSSTPGLGTTTSVNADSYSETDYSSATSSYSESATYSSGTSGSTSGTFNTSSSETATYNFTDNGTNGFSQSGPSPAGPASLGAVDNSSIDGNGWENGTYIDQGSFNAPYGNSGSRSTSYSQTGSSYDFTDGTGWGPYTNAGQSGAYKNTSVEAVSDNGWETGWHTESGTAPSAASASFSDSTSASAFTTQNDGGNYGGPWGNPSTGTYSSYAIEQDTGSGFTNGSRTSGLSGTSASGTFGDDDLTLAEGGGSQSYSPAYTNLNLAFVPGSAFGPDTLDGDWTDHASTSFHDNGTFNSANSGGESRTAGFSTTTRGDSTSDQTDSGAFYYYGAGGPYSVSDRETNVSSATTSGTYTSAIGAYNTSANLTADSLSTSKGGEERSAGNTAANSYSDSASADEQSVNHEGGTYTTANSVTQTANIGFTQSTTGRGQGEVEQTSSAALAAGTTTEISDTSNASTSSYSASGERVVTAAVPTDTGSYKSYKYGTNQGTDDLTQPYVSDNGTLATNSTGNLTSEYYETGTYTNVQGAQTALAANFSSHSTQALTESDTGIATAPSDPGTNWTSTFNATSNTSDWRDGSRSISLNTNSTTENFITETKTSTTRTFNESSDLWSPPAQGVVWNDTGGGSDFFGLKHIVQPENPHGDQDHQGPSAPTFNSSSSTARISETNTANSTVTGTTTSGSGAPSTSSKFNTINTANDFAYLEAASPAGFDVGQANAAGQVMTGSAQFNETDTSNGTNTYGVVNDNYNNVSSETASYSYFITSDTTATATDPLYQSSDWRWTSNSLTSTGSYTTSNIPAGQPGFIPPSPSNPGGWPKFNQTHKENVSMSQTVSLIDSSGPDYALNYSGTAFYSTTSNRTVAFDASQNLNTDSGSYNTVGFKGEWSTLDGTGTFGDAGYGVSWKFHDYLGTPIAPVYKSLQDSGTYPNGGNATEGTGTNNGWTETATTWFNSLGLSLTTTSTSSYSGGGSGSTAVPDDAGDDEGLDTGDSPPPGTYEDQDIVPYTVRTEPYTVTSNDVGGSAWDGYLWNVAHTAKGYFIDGPWALLKGGAIMVWNNITDPIGTAIGQWQFGMQAVQHPLDTLNALKTEFWDKRVGTLEGQGAIAFDIASAIVGFADAAVSIGSKAGILGRGARIAGEAGELASAGRFLAGHNEYVIVDAAKAASTKQELLAFFTKNSPNPKIRWIENLVVDGVKKDAVLNTETGEILMEAALKQPKWEHLVEGYLMEELQHFKQVFDRGLLGQVLPDALQAELESEVVGLILDSGFRIFLGS